MFLFLYLVSKLTNLLDMILNLRKKYWLRNCRLRCCKFRPCNFYGYEFVGYVFVGYEFISYEFVGYKFSIHLPILYMVNSSVIFPGARVFLLPFVYSSPRQKRPVDEQNSKYLLNKVDILSRLQLFCV